MPEQDRKCPRGYRRDPRFDSMKAVNLQLSVESNCHAKLDDLPLQAATTIRDSMAYLAAAGIPA